MALASVGCDDDPALPTGPPELQIGIPEIGVRTGFVALVPGGAVYYSGAGQGGLFMMFALRLRGMGDSVFVKADVTNLRSQEVAPRPEFPRAEKLACASDGWCTYSPLMISVLAFADLGKLQGAPITAAFTVRTKDGRMVAGTASGVLMDEPYFGPPPIGPAPGFAPDAGPRD